MIDLPATPQRTRALELAIIDTFFNPALSAAQIAVAFSSGSKKLHAADVLKIWAEAKARGDLPKLNRPQRRARGSNSEKSKAQA